MRVLNTNIDGRWKIAFAITAIKGVGRRYAHVVLRKADIDLTKRAGELTKDEVKRVITIMQNPRQYKIPDWFLNRQTQLSESATATGFGRSAWGQGQGKWVKVSLVCHTGWEKQQFQFIGVAASGWWEMKVE